MQELLDEVWSDVVVTSDSVYQVVAVLRRTLGDDSKEPRYIATLPRRGYRLVATVVSSTGPQSDPSMPPRSIPIADTVSGDAATCAGDSGREQSARASSPRAGGHRILR